mgnify:CR=1 FL=1
MNKKQELLTITMEECGELVQACSKLIRFEDDRSPEDLKNISDLPALPDIKDTDDQDILSQVI